MSKLMRLVIPNKLHEKVKFWKKRLGYGTMAELIREAIRDFILRKEAVVQREREHLNKEVENI